MEGRGLATQTASPSATTPLPVTLSGTTVSVQDAAGVLRLGQVFYVGPDQVDFVAPAATVTDAGTDAAVVLLLTSDTTAPPTGAAAPRVTVPVLPAPPVTEVGFSVTDANGGFTVSVAALLAPL